MAYRNFKKDTTVIGEDFLPLCFKAVRENGEFISRKAARENGGQSTADLALEWLAAGITASEEDQFAATEAADALIEKVKEVGGYTSDFERDVCYLAQCFIARREIVGKFKAYVLATLATPRREPKVFPPRPTFPAISAVIAARARNHKSSRNFSYKIITNGNPIGLTYSTGRGCVWVTDGGKYGASEFYGTLDITNGTFFVSKTAREGVLEDLTSIEKNPSLLN